MIFIIFSTRESRSLGSVLVVECSGRKGGGHDEISFEMGNFFQMRPDVKKHLFHLAWAPEKIDARAGLGPLMDYLDANLKVSAPFELSERT